MHSPTTESTEDAKSRRAERRFAYLPSTWQSRHKLGLSRINIPAVGPQVRTAIAQPLRHPEVVTIVHCFLLKMPHSRVAFIAILDRFCDAFFHVLVTRAVLSRSKYHP